MHITNGDLNNTCLLNCQVLVGMPETSKFNCPTEIGMSFQLVLLRVCTFGEINVMYGNVYQ